MKEKGIMDHVGETRDIIDGLHNAQSQGVEGCAIMYACSMLRCDDPGAIEWHVDGLVPSNYVTIIAGDGGTGKSTLALELLYCVVTGTPFFGHDVRQSNALYVDFELHKEEQLSRWLQLLKGKGTDAYGDIFDGVKVTYVRPLSSLSDSTLIEELLTYAEMADAELVIIDSLTIGLGGDANRQDEVINAMRNIEKLPTVVALDHVSKKQGERGSKLKGSTPHGSIFKRNFARSLLMLGRADGGGTILRHEKSNFGRNANTIFYEAVYDEDPRGPIRLEQRKISDEVMAGSIDHLSSDEVTLMAVHDIYAVKQDSVTKDEILRWRAEVGAEIAGRTLDNALGRLLKANQLIKVATGLWKPIDADCTAHNNTALGTVHRANATSTGLPIFDVGTRVKTPDGDGTIADGTLSNEGRYAVRLDSSAQYEVTYYWPYQLLFPDEGSPQ